MSLSPYFQPTEGGDTLFSVESSKIKFGFGALEKVGFDARSLEMTRVAIYTDPNDESNRNSKRVKCCRLHGR